MPGWHTRLWRRVKIAPGVSINLSKSGPSLSVGPRGAKVTFGRRGVRQTIGIPGTGLYATKTSHPLRDASASPGPHAHPVNPPLQPSGPFGTGPAQRSGTSSRNGCVGCLLIIGVLTVLGLVGSLTHLGPSATPTPTLAPTPGPAVVATATPAAAASASPVPTTSPTAAPTPTPAPAFPLSITAPSAAVKRGASVTVSVRTLPKAVCRLDVPLRARTTTLTAVTASSGGLARWTWHAGSTAGRYPFAVTCVTAAAAASATGVLVVK